MSIDAKAFRQALGAYPTGVTVVTSVADDGKPVGFTANSFSSVSLDPPLLLVCPAKSLSSFQVFEACQRFCINVLAEGQEEVSNVFARFDGDRFAQVGWQQDRFGQPTLDNVAATFSCRTNQVIPAGDHVILLGEVEDYTHSGVRGLGYAAGRYFSLGMEQAAAAAAPKGRLSFAGALVLSGDAILMVPEDDGWSLPCVRIDGDGSVRTGLTDWFAAAGLSITLRRTYSIFDGNEGEHFTYFLASTGVVKTEIGQFIPLAELGGLAIASAAERAMLDRFVHENETGAFGFYVGDSVSGYVHAQSDDQDEGGQ